MALNDIIFYEIGTLLKDDLLDDDKYYSAKTGLSDIERAFVDYYYLGTTTSIGYKVARLMQPSLKTFNSSDIVVGSTLFADNQKDEYTRFAMVRENINPFTTNYPQFNTIRFVFDSITREVDLLPPLIQTINMLKSKQLIDKMVAEKIYTPLIVTEKSALRLFPLAAESLIACGLKLDETIDNRFVAAKFT